MNEGERANGTKLGLLIDAGNIRVQYMQIILREASALGTIAVRRIYGDFAGNETNNWHKSVHDFALTPIHVPPRAKGKNSADMKLAIDAMDLLHQKQLDGFCIASSDSDFTTLANRIREDGLPVFGFGEKKATAPMLPLATGSSIAICSCRKHRMVAPKSNARARNRPRRKFTQPSRIAPAKTGGRISGKSAMFF